jgi:hypothetical protein
MVLSFGPLTARTVHLCMLTLYRQRFSQQIETAETATILANWKRG